MYASAVLTRLYKALKITGFNTLKQDHFTAITQSDLAGKITYEFQAISKERDNEGQLKSANWSTGTLYYCLLIIPLLTNLTCCERLCVWRSFAAFITCLYNGKKRLYVRKDFVTPFVTTKQPARLSLRGKKGKEGEGGNARDQFCSLLFLHFINIPSTSWLPHPENLKTSFRITKT